MKLKELLNHLAWADRHGIWCMTTKSLQLRFKEGSKAFEKSMGEHVRSGYLVRVARGIYVNPSARSMPADVLRGLVPFLRPLETNYISLETALHDAGRISQIPGRLTVVTSGRSALFETQYGTIEFVHSTGARNEEWLNPLAADLQTAPPEVAEREMRRHHRDTGLIEAA